MKSPSLRCTTYSPSVNLSSKEFGCLSIVFRYAVLSLGYLQWPAVKKHGVISLQTCRRRLNSPLRSGRTYNIIRSTRRIRFLIQRSATRISLMRYCKMVVMLFCVVSSSINILNNSNTNQYWQQLEELWNLWGIFYRWAFFQYLQMLSFSAYLTHHFLSAS